MPAPDEATDDVSIDFEIGPTDLDETGANEPALPLPDADRMPSVRLWAM